MYTKHAFRLVVAMTVLFGIFAFSQKAAWAQVKAGSVFQNKAAASPMPIRIQRPASVNVPNQSNTGTAQVPMPGQTNTGTAQVPVPGQTIAGAGATTGAVPPAAPVNVQAFFNAADTNRDGRLTFDELRAYFPFLTQLQFHQLDANGDGVLSAQEAAAGMAQAQQPAPQPSALLTVQLFNNADVNRDGMVSAAELAAVSPQFPTSLFLELDTNKDGILSSAEWAAGMRLMAQTNVNPAAASSAAIMQSNTTQPDTTQQNTAQPNTTQQNTAQPSTAQQNALQAVIDPSLMRADLDKDGKLTYRELQTIMPQLTIPQFNKADRNGDGFLTPDELALATPFTPVRLNGQAVTFQEADANRDGKVTAQELAEVAPNFRRDQFVRLDINGDGALSLNEWTAGVTGNMP